MSRTGPDFSGHHNGRGQGNKAVEGSKLRFQTADPSRQLSRDKQVNALSGPCCTDSKIQFVLLTLVRSKFSMHCHNINVHLL